MRNNLIFLFFGFALCFIFIKSCEKPQKLVMPEKKGTLKVTDTVTITKIVNKPILSTIYKDLIKEVEKEKIVYQNLSVYEKDSVCLEMMELKEYSTRLSNKDLSADISIIHQGRINDVNLNYIIPENEIDKPKQKNFGLSFGIGADFQATTPVIKTGLNYKQYDLDYLRINNQNFVVVGYRVKF